jgi:ABC-2 type transport system permease protein
MIRLIKTELIKQVRRPRTWVALGFVVLVPIIVTVALKTNPPDLGGPGRGGRDVEDRFFFLATQTGLIMPVAALLLMSRFFLVVVLCLFAGDAVASEASWGNLRFLLVRPVGRGRLLGAKLATVALFGLLATALIALSGLTAGVIAFGWHPLDFSSFAALDPRVASLSQTQSELLVHLAIAIGVVTWGLAGVLAFGFMLSTMTDAPAGAVFGAVGLYVVSTILDAIDSVGSIRYGLPTHYVDAWTGLFSENRWTDDMWRAVLLPIPYVLVFCGIAWWWFRRKDVTS